MTLCGLLDAQQTVFVWRYQCISTKKEECKEQLCYKQVGKNIKDYNEKGTEKN